MRRRGYTLIELTVALAIATIVGVAALSAFAMFNQHRVRVERVSTADDIAKIVVQYLVRESQRVGGSVLRPWQAIAVEQDPCRSEPPCNQTCGDLPAVGGDRITFAFLDDTAVQSSCEIAAITVNTIKFTPVSEHGGACCNLLRFRASDGEPDAIEGNALAHEHLMLFKGGATASEERYKAVTYASAPVVNLEQCIFSYVESRQTLPLASPTRPAASEFVVTSAIGSAGNAIPIKVATAYIGCATTDCGNHPENRGLFVFSDRDAGAGTTMSVSSSDSNTLIAPNVADLQVALGYDNNENGEVIEVLGGANDDFAGNVSPANACSVAVDVGTGDLTDATAPDPRVLRMVSVGVIAAIRVNDPNYTSQAVLPGGNLFNARSVHFRALRSKAGFRSLNLLE